MKTMTREEFLAQRRTGVGGSDVAPIFGLSTWSTPLDVYNEKLQLVPDKEETDAMHFGNVLEDVVACEFTRRTGIRVQRRNSMFRHEKHPELIANIDRYCVGEKAVLECKTRNAFAKDEWGESGTDHVPFPYLCQVQHYQTVTGLKNAFLAVLIGGDDFRWYRLPYSERLAKALADKSREFWNDHVLKQIPPPPMTEADIKLVYGKGDLDPITATDEMLRIHEAMVGMQAKTKIYQKELDELKLSVKKFMGDHSVMLHPDGTPLVSWKPHTKEQFSAKALKEKQPTLYGEFSTTVTQRTFLIK